MFINLIISIFEGTYLNFKYTASTSDIDQRFIIPNDNVDTTTLTVKVQNSSSDSTTNTYTLADGLTSTPTSQVYFLQEIENGRYEVYFGDGVLGKVIASMVILSYLITSIVIKTHQTMLQHLLYQEQLVGFQTQL